MKRESATKEATQRFGWSVITGRYKIYNSSLEQIATADGPDEAQLIINALNERERLRELLSEALPFVEAIRDCTLLARLVDPERDPDNKNKLAPRIRAVLNDEEGSGG